MDISPQYGQAKIAFKAEFGTITSTEEEYFYPWRHIYDEKYRDYTPPLGKERQQELLVRKRIALHGAALQPDEALLLQGAQRGAAKIGCMVAAGVVLLLALVAVILGRLKRKPRDAAQPPDTTPPA